MSRFSTEVNTGLNHKDNEAKANEGDLQSNSFVNQHGNFWQHPMRPWNKGKSQKRELNTIHPKVSLPCKWSGFALGRERFLTSSKDFPISLSFSLPSSD